MSDFPETTVTPSPSTKLGLALGACGLAIGALVAGVYASRDRGYEATPLAATVAEVQAVHAPVSAASEPVTRVQRLAVGEVVETASEGRARIRLDDGTTVVVAGDTKVVITSKGLTLERGRVFAQGAMGAHTELGVGSAVAFVSGANVAASRSDAAGSGPARIYSATADITVHVKSDTAVHVGETAIVDGEKVTVVPERAFDDWTYGLAAPWGASGPPRRAVGELWGHVPGSVGDIGSPLTLRSHEINVTLHGEVAETEVRTRFFHAGSTPLDGDFRMALPPGAIVSRFAAGPGDSPSDANLGLATRADDSARLQPGSLAMLEWAGEGWVRGRLAAIAPGAVVTVVVSYVEWLSPQASPQRALSTRGATQTLAYRFPMASAEAPPLIGELSAHIDARDAFPTSMAAGLGAQVHGAIVDLRRSDYRPTADLVVELTTAAAPTPVRLYTAPAASDDDGGDYVLARAELPAPKADDGVALAFVVDTSGSIEPSMLDASRALVASVLSAMGPHDRVVVLAADDSVRPIGPARMGPVDAARRKATLAALDAVTVGGATDLGRALDAAADSLDPTAASPMVVYVGDGFPSMGDLGADAIRARLARRATGAPRLAAVAVGPVSNRFALASLVRGGGPLLDVSDRADAPAAAMTLLAEALRPAVSDVELDLGPSVEQTYPRGPRSAPAGDTVFTVGRARGELPKSAVLRFRDGAGMHEQTVAVTPTATPLGADVRRRWGAARVEELALRGRGREAATDVALRTGLLTPWTAFVVGISPRAAYTPTPLASRTFDLASGAEGLFTASFETPRGARVLDGPATELSDEPDDRDDPNGYREAVRIASERVLDEAYGSFRACRDSRAALRPDLAGAVNVAFDVDGAGHASHVDSRFVSQDSGKSAGDDAALGQCVSIVIAGLVFPSGNAGVVVHVTHSIRVREGRPSGEGRCSATSLVPLPLRRGVWNEALVTTAVLELFLKAKRGCELSTWADRRAFLELVLAAHTDGATRLTIAGELDAAGEADAAAFVKREALRRASSPDELRALRAFLLQSETYPLGTFRTQYVAAGDDAARLAVVVRYLALAPHDARLRRLQLLLLESSGQKDRLLDAARALRSDPLADAGLLAEAAGALRRVGDDAEARRTYGEIIERAPDDPWARAFAGDRYASEGWFDDAIRVYDGLDRLAAGDPLAILRTASAHGAAGRLDIAERMLTRAMQQGGLRDAQVAALAGDVAQVLVGESRARPSLSADERDSLARRAATLPHAAAGAVVVVRAPAWGAKLDVTFVRGAPTSRQETHAEMAAPGLGAYVVRVNGKTDGAILRIAMKKQLAPAVPLAVRISSLTANAAGEAPSLTTTDVRVPTTGAPVELRWDHDHWVAS